MGHKHTWGTRPPKNAPSWELKGTDPPPHPRDLGRPPHRSNNIIAEEQQCKALRLQGLVAPHDPRAWARCLLAVVSLPVDGEKQRAPMRANAHDDQLLAPSFANACRRVCGLPTPQRATHRAGPPVHLPQKHFSSLFAGLPQLQPATCTWASTAHHRRRRSHIRPPPL